MASSCIIPDSSCIPSTGSQPPILKEEAGIELTATDKQVISSGQWLNDVISAWQRMLAQKFPEIGGMEDTIKQNAASVIKGKFVQVMNLGGCHWVAVSNIGCDEDVINWMDIAYMACLHQLRRDKFCIPHCWSLQYNASTCSSSGMDQIVASLPGVHYCSLSW